MCINIDAMNKTIEDFVKKIYLSLYCKVCEWERVGDRTELQYIDPHSYGHQRCVFLVLLMSNRRPSLSGTCSHSSLFSLTGLVSKLNRGSRGPLLLGCGFSLPHLVSNSSLLQLTGFLSSPSYIIVPSPTQSLEWHVWSSSSGNNCHVVYRSLSSGASVYECTMGFLPCPIFSTKPAYAISSHKCHLNVSLPSGASLWNGLFGRVEGQYITKERNLKQQMLIHLSNGQLFLVTNSQTFFCSTNFSKVFIYFTLFTHPSLI